MSSTKKLPIIKRGREFRKEYEKGATVQQLADKYGCHLSTMHRSLVAAGTAMRRTGYNPGEKDKNKPKKGLLAWLEN